MAGSTAGREATTAPAASSSSSIGRPRSDDADIGTLCGAVAALQVGAREGGGVGGRAGADAGAARVERVAQLHGASGVGLEEEALCQALAACTFHGGGVAGGAGGAWRRVWRLIAINT
eukprot:COSAG01_NODE_2230_length_8125_cov_9.414652_9_plen_118_part_00